MAVKASGLRTGKLACVTAARGIRLLFAGRKLQFRRHPNQFCQRISLHLAHHVAAMDLHCDFAGPEIRSYLLNELARNHQAHDFALACRQRLVPFSRLGKVTLQLARHTSRSKAWWIASSKPWSWNGLVGNSTAPDFMAFTDIGISP